MPPGGSPFTAWKQDYNRYIKMKIMDTYNDIFSVYKHDKFNMVLWQKYAENISNELKKIVEQDADRYDFVNQCLPVLNNLIGNKQIVETAHDSFLKVTENLSQKILDAFGVDLDVTIVFYLGLCNGAGWATKLSHKPAVLLGIEKIVELNWCDENEMAALLYHELGHIWHFLFEQKKKLPLTAKENAIRQLYREGIAMTFEQILCNNSDFFHQNISGWLDWCKANESAIKSEYLRRMENKESVQDFFGDWESYKGHSDVGYFLGSRFIRYMMQEYSLQEIAGFKIKTVYKKFREYVKTEN